MTFPQTITPTQANKETPIVEMFSSLKWASTYTNDPLNTSALNRGYNGGRWGGFVVADATHTFGASTTTYVSVDLSDGSLDFSTSSTNYNDDANYAKVETVVTSASAVTSVTDDRGGPGGVHGGGGDATTTDIATDIHAATGKTTPIDADELGITDSAASYGLKKLTFANLGAWVWTKLGALINGGTDKSTPVDADSLALSDSAASNATKRLTWANLKATLATYVATLGYASTTYVDAAVNGRSWKTAVRAATTANGTLATAFANGQTIDGVTLATGDRILIKNQSSGAENGIYIVAASGAPARATDADSGAELVNASMYVSEGTTQADQQWTCTTNAPITLGSTALAFVQSGSGSTYTADGTTLDLTGTVFSIKTGGVGTGQLAADAVTYAKIQNVSATDKLLGRSTAGAGDVEEITCTAAARSVLDDTTVSAMRATLQVGQVCIAIACSDETTALTSGTNKVKFINPYSTAFNVTAVVGSLSTAQASGSILTIDVNEAGTTILSTKLTIDNTETNSSTAATAAVISDASIAAYAEMEVDIDQVGDGTAKGLKVYILGYPS